MGFWTLTAWRNEAAMVNYLRSDPHRRDMPYMCVWCDEASVVHWQQDSRGLPTPATVLERMVAEGRLSELVRPSTAHAAGRAAPAGREPRPGQRLRPSATPSVAVPADSGDRVADGERAR